MKPVCAPLLLLAAGCVALPALARDDLLHMAFEELLVSPLARAKLDPAITFYLAGAKTPALLEAKESDTSTQHTYSVGKSPEQSCNWAGLSALLAFQKKAKALGANAVVDIVSYDKNDEVRSSTTFECRTGAVMTRVALKGRYAKVAK